MNDLLVTEQSVGLWKKFGNTSSISDDKIWLVLRNKEKMLENDSLCRSIENEPFKNKLKWRGFL
jgi:hypothetical protein